MEKNFLKKVVIVWFLFMPIAILNGVVRNSFYQPLIGELPAHQLSTLIGVFIFMGFVYFVLGKKISQLSWKSNLLVGMIWLLMTILFEFVFGHYVVGHSWQKLFYDYNIFAGRIWSLFLISEFFTPLFIKFLQKGKSI